MCARIAQAIQFPSCMDTRFLETFLSVCDNGSIAEAARRLNLTPASVAQRVHALEDEIGVPLVSRCGHSVKVTEAGMTVLEKARAFIQNFVELKATATGEKLDGDLRLGACGSMLNGILPPVLAIFSRKYPGISVSIAAGTAPYLFDQVHAGELDAAVIVKPPFPLPKTLDWKSLRKEPLVLLTPASLRVTSVNATLRTEPFIRFGRRAWGGGLVDNYLRSMHIHPRERFDLDSPNSIAILVDRGLGVALLPDWSHPWPEGLSLVKTEVGGPSFDRHVGVIWPTSSLRIRFIRLFVAEASMRICIRNDGNPSVRLQDS